jgi:hypothetical protein
VDARAVADHCQARQGDARGDGDEDRLAANACATREVGSDGADEDPDGVDATISSSEATIGKLLQNVS